MTLPAYIRDSRAFTVGPERAPQASGTHASWASAVQDAMRDRHGCESFLRDPIELMPPLSQRRKSGCRA
eukprot:5362863-Pyramimonas_sp.AAC.1